jgi:hypothetical protein
MISFDVLSGDGERGARDIRCINCRAGEGQREKDREAARPCAQVEHSLYFLGSRDPGPEPLAQQLGDKGARHDDALVHVEAVIAEPGFVDQVGEGLSRVHALIDQPLGLALFLNGQLAICRSREFLVRNPQHMCEHPCRLVAGVVRAVSEVQGCAPQLPPGGCQPVAQSAIAGALQDARSRASRRR